MRNLTGQLLTNRFRDLRDFARRKNLRSLLPYSLICAGAALLIYVSSQYALMYRDQHDLAKQWAQQNSASSASLRPAADTSAANTLVRITIPKINLDAIVVEGTSAKELLRGPGHIRSSAYPGEQGNVVISAHRDTFFRHIVELTKGDQIELQRGGAIYTYEVTGKKITDPNDISVIQATQDARLTLITCYPTYYIGPAPERLVVFSRLVSPAPIDQATVSRVAAPASTDVHPKPE
jgi:sortase A